MKSIKESKWLYILISILIASTIWMYVRVGEDPELENRVRDIPVTVSGDRVLENQGLMVDSLSHECVTLVWKGRWNDVSRLGNDNVSVSVDVSRITEPGTYELEYTINFPPAVPQSAVSLQTSYPEQITVTVSKIYSKTFDIHPVFKGSVAAGYQAGQFILDPETVLVSGTQEKVDSINEVQVILDQKDLKSSFSGDLPLVLVDERGRQIEHAGLRFSAETVYTYLPIVVMKEIPLDIDIITGGGATDKNIEYKITPKTITVSGPEEEMAHLDKLTLGSIDLAQVMGSYTHEYPVFVPADMENVSGISKATVEITVKDLNTKTVEVENIELANVPKGYKAALVTQALTIVLRGTPESLDKVQTSQIRVVADLAELSATGSYNVPVKVYLYADSGVGVIGQNNVVVNLTKR
ncbi:MAG: hypothetical protein J6A62_08395 [Oscillospiraceae bacterium]|nr:hypothetical protein [Oscillospiraceae bacterium]